MNQDSHYSHRAPLLPVVQHHFLCSFQVVLSPAWLLSMMSCCGFAEDPKEHSAEPQTSHIMPLCPSTALPSELYLGPCRSILLSYDSLGSGDLLRAHPLDLEPFPRTQLKPCSPALSTHLPGASFYCRISVPC